ncbi:MAG TPA: DUF885 domain-containing protein [Candidatus Polarisedimenticolia bacterium]|nr:DUF885 domain-containing protein [Candidatus Polarisedimenticolia bacterium]
MSHFDALVERFLDEAFALDPVSATEIGRHEFDDRWTDLSETGRHARLAWAERWMAELQALRADDLTPAERIDRDRLLMVVEDDHWDATAFRPERWSPMIWVYVLGGGLFGLLSREFSPLAVRLTSVCGRLDGMSGVVAAAREQLIGFDGRPVSRFHTETAIGDIEGVIALIRSAVTTAESAAADGDGDVAALLPQLRGSAGRAEAAVEELKAHLRDVVLPRSEGEGRLGPELYAQRLTRVLADPSLTPEHVLAEGERAFAAVRKEMVRIAREIWPQWRPGDAMPDDEGELVRGVLDAVAEDRPTAETLLDDCRASLERIEAFCRETELIGLPDEPLAIEWTPTFLRSFANAMLDAPGPFDRSERTFFFVTPPDDDWPKEQVDSYLREQNRRQLAILTIHEAVPGHYLQIAYGNKASSLVRSVFGDSQYAEGWAVYVTQVMIDRGFADGDPALLLAHWKYFLRAATNAILDVRTHTEGLTEADALDLMIRGGFQEEAEARAKWRRARLSSGQLCTYFVGGLAFWDLERAVRLRRAAEAGAADPEAVVPHQRIVGDLGETPGFNYRAHLEAVISTGKLPLPLLRRAILPD